MLTNLVEGGKVKCLQYWPDTDSKSYGPFEVTITDRQMFADYLIRVIQVEVSMALQDMKLVFRFATIHMVEILSDLQLTPQTCSMHTQLSGSTDSPLKVTQFHFTAWPDHGVPDYATPILAFHRRVKSQHDSVKGPLLVHCRYKVAANAILINDILCQCTCQVMMVFNVPMHNKLY